MGGGFVRGPQSGAIGARRSRERLRGRASGRTGALGRPYISESSAALLLHLEPGTAGSQHHTCHIFPAMASLDIDLREQPGESIALGAQSGLAVLSRCLGVGARPPRARPGKRIGVAARLPCVKKSWSWNVTGGQRTDPDHRRGQGAFIGGRVACRRNMSTRMSGMRCGQPFFLHYAVPIFLPNDWELSCKGKLGPPSCPRKHCCH